MQRWHVQSSIETIPTSCMCLVQKKSSLKKPEQFEIKVRLLLIFANGHYSVDRLRVVTPPDSQETPLMVVDANDRELHPTGI